MKELSIYPAFPAWIIFSGVLAKLTPLKAEPKTRAYFEAVYFGQPSQETAVNDESETGKVNTRVFSS